MTPEQKVAEFKKIVEEMAKLYEQKNKNYGDSFGELYKELGPTAGLVPLWNKLHRATSLIKGNKNNFESLEDTFKDLACYAIMNLIALKSECISDINISPTEEIGVETTPLVGTLDHSKCVGCLVYKQITSPGGYVGDTPCLWCPNNPYKLSCHSGTYTITSGSFAPQTIATSSSDKEKQIFNPVKTKMSL